MRTRHVLYAGIVLLMLAMLSATAGAADKTCNGRPLRNAVNDAEYSAWFCAYSLQRFGASIASTACETTLRDIDALTAVKRRLDREGCTQFISGPTDDERRTARRALDYLQDQLIRTGAALPR